MPGEGLLNFANAYWPFSSLGACSFDAARLAAWRSVDLFQGGRAKAGTGCSCGHQASRERRTAQGGVGAGQAAALTALRGEAGLACGLGGAPSPPPKFIGETDHPPLLSDLENSHPL